MSELRSAVEALRSETLPELPDARIEEDFAELQRTVELLEVERLRRLAEIERRRLFERDGHLSAVSWLATTFKVAWGTAREHVRVARALEEMPETRRALDVGDLSMSAVRVLVAARDADPSAFRRSEAQLVEDARIDPFHARPPACRGVLAPGSKATTSSESGGGSTRRSRSSAWCGWTVISIPRRERPC
ncbi:MAG: DUF222 domain-containing protein [Actinobacteria bacterium]|nr:DUF222 domain-containing protein [Actinomycetota bacterium]